MADGEKATSTYLGHVDHDAKAQATRLDSEVFPYEAHWRSRKQRSDNFGLARIVGWVVCIPVAIVLPLLADGAVRDVIECARVLLEGRADGGDVASFVIACFLLPLFVFPVIYFVVKIVKVVIADHDGSYKPTPGGDASTVYPDISLVDRRSARCDGDAYPLVADDIGDDSAVSAAWRIPNAGPLWAVSGYVVDTLVLDAWCIAGTEPGDMKEFSLHFVLLEYVDTDGDTVRCWSNALLGIFSPGQRVTAYLYRFASGGGRSLLRVHDVTDASRSVNVKNHQAVVFSARLAEHRCWTTRDMSTRWPGGARSVLIPMERLCLPGPTEKLGASMCCRSGIGPIARDLSRMRLIAKEIGGL